MVVGAAVGLTVVGTAVVGTTGEAVGVAVVGTAVVGTTGETVGEAVVGSDGEAVGDILGGSKLEHPDVNFQHAVTDVGDGVFAAVGAVGAAVVGVAVATAVWHEVSVYFTYSAWKPRDIAYSNESDEGGHCGYTLWLTPS
eukprot:CAMPEP_0197026920 /NCGR_PEP_ID=MMETSP1384-20130603/6924_1 /TAXON_ID=29189 /ORGANISM="Ammonia sp." /LENGTH=139 /DNA_ID=CAMNT_0042455685 /DNA_START=127 /DNA_END=546 /DNA_ORIENTATION=-